MMKPENDVRPGETIDRWDGDIVSGTELLNTELPADRFVDPSYLHWLYRENPLGMAMEGNRWEAAGPDGTGRQLVAHYGLIPQEFRTTAGPVPALFSLNAAIRSTSQQKGYFTKIATELNVEAAERQIRVGTAVTNANSTTAAVKYLGWRLLGPMPVVLVAPTWSVPSPVSHRSASQSYLDSAEFRALSQELDRYGVEGYVNRYSPDYLRWRLSWPNCPYHVHVAEDLVAISAKTVQSGVPAAAILKLLPRGEKLLDSAAIAAGPLIGSIIRHHKVPLAVYAGWNRHAKVRGIVPPRKLLPSPLNALVRSFTDDIQNDEIDLDTFEFLDMDAY